MHYIIFWITFQKLSGGLASSCDVLLLVRVANVKNQPPNFKQLTPCTRRAHWCLKQSHTKTSSRSVYCKRTAPKLLYVAKGLKYEWYHYDDVMQISTLNLNGQRPGWGQNNGTHCKTKACDKQFSNPSQDVHDPLPYILFVGSLCWWECPSFNVQQPIKLSHLLSGDHCVWLCILYVLHVFCARQNVVSKSDPWKIENESLVNGLNWKCTLCLVWRHTSDCPLISILMCIYWKCPQNEICLQ